MHDIEFPQPAPAKVNHPDIHCQIAVVALRGEIDRLHVIQIALPAPVFAHCRSRGNLRRTESEVSRQHRYPVPQRNQGSSD